MDSIDADDVERVEDRYVDANATRDDAIQSSLEAAGFEGNSADAFSSFMATADDVAESVDTSHLGSGGERGIATREDVAEAAGRVDKQVSGSRQDALVDEAARELGAPSESSLDAARGRALQNLDGNTLRSDPSLDPLAEGGEGRVVADLSDGGGLGTEDGVRTGVEPTDGGKGTYYAEDTAGNRYPLAEVDL